ncbi:PPE family protein [Mycobacterium bourgelatii]|uniref:PPE family protein n=2 Tax=Mycobacterium bourgelatii TaxID=1273442 RepID=A0A7I9YMB5_MYCBU|nr:PPE family protein [Mycobacterium bourgelatii]
MYAGAGAAPMLAAAAAWNGIAAELGNTASSFEAIITRLTSEQWLGPASLSMAAAAQPFLTWLNYTAESAGRAATQALASASAFGAAFAMTVPPADVAANRAQLAELVASNLLGQNGSAIAATEARYGEMWAQDAMAMYEYAAASALAGKLEPLTSPWEATNPAGITNQAATVGQAGASGGAQRADLGTLVNKGPDALMALASPAASTLDDSEWVTLYHEIDEVAELGFFHYGTHGLGGVADYTTDIITNAVVLGAGNQTQSISSAAISGGSASGSGLKTAIAGSPPLAAALGDAAAVGGLSVPKTWSLSAPVLAAGTDVHLAGWVAPEEDELIEGVTATPGMVVGADDERLNLPRYGVKPVVMPKRGF